nr:unnamed protein product [Callosobruchus analis]
MRISSYIFTEIITQNTPQGILSNIGCPDIPIRQAARSAFNTVVRLVGLEGSSDEGDAEPVLLNEECDRIPDENVGQCAKSGRRRCPKCPPPPLAEYTKSAIHAISNLLGLQTEPGEDIVNPEENGSSQEKDTEVTKAEAGSDTPPATDPNAEESNEPPQEQVDTHTGRCKNKKCPPPPFGETTRNVANAIGQYIGFSKEAGDISKPDDEGVVKEETTETKTVDKEQAVTKADLEKPACPPKPASYDISEGVYTQTENQLSIVTRSAYQTVVRLIGSNELPEENAPEPELVSEERNKEQVTIKPDDRAICRTCARYGRKKCAPPPLGQYTRSAIRTISNIKDYMRNVRVMEVSKETSSNPKNDNGKSNQETSVPEETHDDQTEASSSSDRQLRISRPPNYSVGETVLKPPDMPLKQTTRSAFQANIHLAEFDDKPKKEPELVNDTADEAEVQETTKSCSKHGRKKCPPPPLSEYTKSAVQGISHLIGMQKEDVEEKISDESSDEEAETTAVPPPSDENTTTAEGQPSGEASLNTVTAESTRGQCRSKCSPPPLAESTRSMASAIGRFIGLAGEEIGENSTTKDENAETEKNEANGESQASACQPKPTSYKTHKIMHNHTMTLNETTNAVFRMFGRVLGATREGREHGDNFPFDGRGVVLAHAFFPTGMRSSIEVHFDADEAWTTDGSSDEGARDDRRQWGRIPEYYPPLTTPSTTTTTTFRPTTRAPITSTTSKPRIYYTRRPVPYDPRYPQGKRPPYSPTQKTYYPQKPMHPDKKPHYPRPGGTYPYGPDKKHPYHKHTPDTSPVGPEPQHPQHPHHHTPDRRYPDHHQPDKSPDTHHPERVHPTRPRPPSNPDKYPAGREHPHHGPPKESPLPPPDTCDTSYDAVAVIRREVFIFKDAVRSF